MRQKSTGTLVIDALTPARRLFMISTGTGIAPFASLIRDPDTYEKFDQIILTQTCRDSAELTYGSELVERAAQDPLIGEFTAGRLSFYSSTTREISQRMGRITHLMQHGKLYADLGIEALNPETDRVMICGSIHMLKDVKEFVEAAGFVEGSLSHPGSFVVERAFVG
jgi:ferredoxin--NADP+ reductase